MKSLIPPNALIGIRYNDESVSQQINVYLSCYHPYLPTFRLSLCNIL